MTRSVTPMPPVALPGMAMNVWSPAPDQATAERLYRLVPRFALPTCSLVSFINKGWTLAAMLEHGYAEAAPAQPMPPMMPASDTMKALSPAWSFGAAKEPSDITKEVVRQIVNRDNHGQNKYGVSLDRTDLTAADWCQHMAEELMDAAHYALCIKREAERRQQAMGERFSKAMKSTQDNARALLSDVEFKVVERTLNYFWHEWQNLADQELPE